MVKRLLTFSTNRIYELPILILMPHSRCNCRCVMCDIWKANNEKKEISTEELVKHISSFEKLNVREVVFSGGEALMHSNLWKMCSLLKDHGIRITLLSTGLSIERNAVDIVRYCDEVIVSLDGDQETHDRIRNIPGAFEKLATGVAAIKTLSQNFPVKGRCVLQRLNYREFDKIVEASRKIRLDQISFLAADTTSTAFNREAQWPKEKINDISLNLEQANELEKIFVNSFSKSRGLYESGFIAESMMKILAIAKYYKAINGLGSFPKPKCNAPWVSAVVESDGTVRPCFFHESLGNFHEADFNTIVNSPKAMRFRRELDVSKNEICARCVCSLHVGLMKTF